MTNNELAAAIADRFAPALVEKIAQEWRAEGREATTAEFMAEFERRTAEAVDGAFALLAEGYTLADIRAALPAAA